MDVDARVLMIPMDTNGYRWFIGDLGNTSGLPRAGGSTPHLLGAKELRETFLGDHALPRVVNGSWDSERIGSRSSPVKLPVTI